MQWRKTIAEFWSVVVMWYKSAIWGFSTADLNFKINEWYAVSLDSVYHKPFQITNKHEQCSVMQWLLQMTAFCA